MTISANQLRPGIVIQQEGILWQCLESVHKTPGNLRAFVQAKMRNVQTGVQKEFRYSSTEMLDRVLLRERASQYLYIEGGHYYFMDSENFEQFPLSTEVLGDAVGFLLPDAQVNITFFEDKPIGLRLPQTLVFTVIEAEPGMKAATASASYKNAKIETGKTVRVPQFVDAGDKIVVNTETGDYVERAK